VGVLERRPNEKMPFGKESVGRRIILKWVIKKYNRTS
jgi:hypothetical protein